MLENDLMNAFKEHENAARQRAEAEGKTEVTPEEFSSLSAVRLNGLYDRWKDDYYDSKNVLGRFKNLEQSMREFMFSFIDLENFSRMNESDALEYAAFMVIAGSVAKDKSPQTTWSKDSVFAKDNKYLPTLGYLFGKTRNAKVSLLPDLETVALNGVEWGSLSEFSRGTLRICCQLGFLGNDIGYKMTGGKIIIMGDSKPRSIGVEMSGGTIIYEGDLKDCEVGTRMSGDSKIRIKGCVMSGDVGYQMRGGTIEIEREYVTGKNLIYGIGYEMKKGTIVISGNFTGNSGSYNNSLGCHMEGGTVKVEGFVSGPLVSVGTRNKAGSVVSIGRDCNVYEVGSLMEGGTIIIRGDAGYSIGPNMESGKIEINGSVNQYSEKYAYPLGSHMKGGRIIIGGNASEVSSNMFGGRIDIGGRLKYEDTLLISDGFNGEVYVRGRYIQPITGWGIVKKLLRGD